MSHDVFRADNRAALELLAYYADGGFPELRLFGGEVDVVRGVYEIVGEAEFGARILKGRDEGIRQGWRLAAARRA